MSEAGQSDTDRSGAGLGEADKTAGAYRVLARKYRPSNFSELIGQEPMVRTLTNAFATGRIAQAWMLTGVRGVGKTTTARILARALNYKTDAADQPTVDLAVLGEHCRAIMEGRHVDVIEMDAASHTGIDDIRDIIDRVRYAPVSARYKVYIIDEVHMLSNQAFNGLLKTLEEPPAHVKFIFATTEIRKVPITVLSRCQRFDLRRIDAGTLVAHLSSISQKEGITVDDEALAMIARAAEGSARDSLSILDQAIAHGGGGGSVGAAEVRAMLGLADRARVVDLFEHVMKGDVAAALAEFRSQYDTGADPAAVLTDLAEFNHLVTRLRFVPEAIDDASLSQEERSRGAVFARTLSVRVLSRSWQMLLKGIPEVQSSNRPVSAAEMVLIRLAHAADLPTLDEALSRLEGEASSPSSGPRANAIPAPVREHASAKSDTSGGPVSSSVRASSDSVPSGSGGGGGSVTARASSGGGGAQAVRLVAATPVTEPVAAVPTPQPPAQTEPSAQVKSLAEIIALAESHRDQLLKVHLRSHVRFLKAGPNRLDVGLTEAAPKTLLGELKSKLEGWTGQRWMVSLSNEAGGQTLAEAEAARRESAFMDARSDPAVAAVLARFPGAKIIDVRIPDAPDEAAGDADLPAEPAIDDDDDS